VYVLRVHQANPYCTSLYCPRIEKHHSVPTGAVLVSHSTTQYHLALSTYQAGFSLHTKFWAIRPSCTPVLCLVFGWIINCPCLSFLCFPSSCFVYYLCVIINIYVNKFIWPQIVSTISTVLHVIFLKHDIHRC
jgi:hypothetical protein